MITTTIFFGNSNVADELCSQTCISSFKAKILQITYTNPL